MIKLLLLVAALSSADSQTKSLVACERLKSEGIEQLSCRQNLQNEFAHPWNAEMSSADQEKLLAQCGFDAPGPTPARLAFFEALKPDILALWPDFDPQTASMEQWGQLMWGANGPCRKAEK